MRVAALVPAYQAAAHLGEVLLRLKGLPAPPDTLVVDDGSRDATAEVARAAGADVVSFPENRGKGHALIAGFRALRDFDAVVTLDADGQHPPEEVPRLVDAWRSGADLVLGTRDHLYDGMSRVRRTSNASSSWLISRVAGHALPDCQTGFRVYARELIESVGFPESRFEAESAVLVRAARRGFRIAGVPIRLDTVDGRATSHYRPVVDSLRIARAVTRARFEAVS